MYEGIRIQPALALPQTKVVGPGGDTLDGQFVPAGTRITVNTWALMRNKELFGEDMETFRPERFIEASDKKRVEMERDIELYFGHGRYMCAGKMIAFMELNKVLFEVCRVRKFLENSCSQQSTNLGPSSSVFSCSAILTCRLRTLVSPGKSSITRLRRSRTSWCASRREPSKCQDSATSSSWQPLYGVYTRNSHFLGFPPFFSVPLFFIIPFLLSFVSFSSHISGYYLFLQGSVEEAAI